MGNGFTRASRSALQAPSAMRITGFRAPGSKRMRLATGLCSWRYDWTADYKYAHNTQNMQVRNSADNLPSGFEMSLRALVQLAGCFSERGLNTIPFKGSWTGG